MNVEIITRPPFAVLGIEGIGPANTGPEWIKPIWKDLYSRIEEIRYLIIGDCWGLMSAVDEPYGRWNQEGKYLAGYEVDLDTQAPDNWTLWKVPETTFAVIACTKKTYDAVWGYFHNQFLPNEEYEIGGAVHEYYPPEFKNQVDDIFYLYFTVK